MEIYRLYTNDCGVNLYSLLGMFRARSDETAGFRASKIAQRYAPVKVVVIPDSLVSKFATSTRRGIYFKAEALKRYGFELS